MKNIKGVFMAQIIDGKACAATLKADIARRINFMSSEYNKKPGLVVVQVGEDPASSVYVRNKIKACAEVGIESYEYKLDYNTTEEALLQLIAQLNANQKIHGILVQLPLPWHINSDKIVRAIDPAKDVDAFHPVNVGNLMLGAFGFHPCTPAGVMTMLKANNIQVAGKECVVVGRSDIVGKPMAMLLLDADGTVTICHSKTQSLQEACKRADILVAAIGKPKFFTADFIKPGAVVIDVGINRDENGKLCGDVDFEAVEPIAGYITPVPGGCGPMTIAMLMQNTLYAFCNSLK
jgi:methylenetetrahydrofolate dehydrogenase (NADP+)/methenyltetrahydrofolate cyclohydrolase